MELGNIAGLLIAGGLGGALYLSKQTAAENVQAAKSEVQKKEKVCCQLL